MANDRWYEERWRDDDERGLFGYEGEGYMRGGARDMDRLRRGDYESDYGRYGQSSARELDEPRSYRGVGPKNYQRSDQRIHEDVCERLERDDYVDPSDVEVQVQGGIVTLSGTVHDRMQKRRAEDLADSCGGVKDVQNNIRVARE